MQVPANNNRCNIAIPALVGIGVSLLLYSLFHWWGFFVIFPWIGLSISIGILIDRRQPRSAKGIGRRTAQLLIIPILLLFVPIANKENLQLEGIILLISIGKSIEQALEEFCGGQTAAIFKRTFKVPATNAP